MRRPVRWLGALVASSLVMVVVAALLKRVLVSQGDETSVEFDRVAILGGDEFGSRARALVKGRVQVVMGGADVDLTAAELAPGAELRVFVKAGGARVVVPSTWRIESDVRALFGGVDCAPPSDALAPDAPLLTVTGNVIFGGLQIARR